MEHYDFAEVWADSSGLRLCCTDSAETDTLLSQLKQFHPEMRMKETKKLPSGDLWFCHIKGLSDEDMNVMWWIIKQLCSRDWEPVGSASHVYGQHTLTDFHYQFKRKTTG